MVDSNSAGAKRRGAVCMIMEELDRKWVESTKWRVLQLLSAVEGG